MENKRRKQIKQLNRAITVIRDYCRNNICEECAFNINCSIAFVDTPITWGKISPEESEDIKRLNEAIDVISSYCKNVNLDNGYNCVDCLFDKNCMLGDGYSFAPCNWKYLKRRESYE